MIRKLLFVSALLICSSSAFARVPAPIFHGAWVTAWTEGFFTPEQVDETLAAAKQAHINNLFIQVRKNADAYYKSDLEHSGAGLEEGFDPLDYIIPKAHKLGIKIHAWVNVYRVWTAPNPPSDIEHIVNAHPEWLNVNFAGQNRSADGVYLDPGCSDARIYILEVIKDIVSRYKVDGIHLDYIRYPGKEWGYSENALTAWQKVSNRTDRPEPTDPDWSDWRRAQVTALVRSIFIAVRSVRPKALVTASTICWGNATPDFEDTMAYADALQNWRKWMSAGYLDAIAPMNYQNHAKAADRFCGWLDGFKRWKAKRPVYVGLYAQVNTPEDIVKQAKLSEESGLGGWVLFSFNKGELRDKMAEALAGK